MQQRLQPEGSLIMSLGCSLQARATAWLQPVRLLPPLKTPSCRLPNLVTLLVFNTYKCIPVIELKDPPRSGAGMGVRCPTTRTAVRIHLGQTGALGRVVRTVPGTAWGHPSAGEG